MCVACILQAYIEVERDRDWSDAPQIVKNIFYISHIQ